MFNFPTAFEQTGGRIEPIVKQPIQCNGVAAHRASGSARYELKKGFCDKLVTLKRDEIEPGALAVREWLSSRQQPRKQLLDLHHSADCRLTFHRVAEARCHRYQSRDRRHRRVH